MGRHRAVIVISIAIALAAVAAARVESIADAPPGVLISRQLAESLHIIAGAAIRLSPDASGANARDFHVTGVYEPVPDPMRINASKHECVCLPDLIGDRRCRRSSRVRLSTPSISRSRTRTKRRYSPAASPRAYSVVARQLGHRASPDVHRARAFPSRDRHRRRREHGSCWRSQCSWTSGAETVGLLRLIGLTETHPCQVLLEGLLIAAA